MHDLQLTGVQMCAFVSYQMLIKYIIESCMCFCVLCFCVPVGLMYKKALSMLGSAVIMPKRDMTKSWFDPRATALMFNSIFYSNT